jgi:uncharacterized metal-binding protein YceD (DUF177 family)
MTPELSRSLRVDTIPAAGRTVEVAATAEERAAVAQRLGVPSVRSLTGWFALHSEGGGVVRAEGRFSVVLERVCVVSLEPFATTQEERFVLCFVPAGSEGDDGDPETDDEVPYAGGSIDLGEALVEQVALDLDPYPRRPDAALPSATTEEPASPFAALAALRRGT